MACGMIWGKGRGKLSAGKSWVARETQVSSALLWKHSPKKKGPRYHTSTYVHFPYDIHFHHWGHTWHKAMPHYVHFSGPGCALISHSDRTLPRHIWFLARLIMTNNVCASAHPCRAPFICLDTIPGHRECLAEGKKSLLCRMALRPMIDLSYRACGDI